MGKAEFIQNLRKNLKGLSQVEVEEIVRDQEEYIREAIGAGRRESDVISSLGDPKALAATLVAESKIDRAANSSSLKHQMKNTTGAVVAILALAPLNLIFVLGPFCALVGVLIGAWSAVGSVTLATFTVLLTFLTKLIFLDLGFWTHVSGLFLILGLLSLGICLLVVMYKLTNVFFRITIRYLKWNLDFITART